MLVIKILLHILQGPENFCNRVICKIVIELYMMGHIFLDTGYQGWFSVALPDISVRSHLLTFNNVYFSIDRAIPNSTIYYRVLANAR